MAHIIVEVKARCEDFTPIQKILDDRDARFVGEDHQIDTYFRVSSGRLKLREGDIERALIYYDRSDERGPKLSNVLLYDPEPVSTLKEILVHANGVLVVVDKYRKIYFIDNVKIHLDRIQSLGTFVEIEAIGMDESVGRDHLQRQCEHYMNLFKIPKEALVSVSYSDMLLSIRDTGTVML